MADETHDTSGLVEGLPTSALDCAAVLLGISAGEIRVTKLAGDASSRRYFRLKSTDSSIIAAVYPDSFEEAESPIDRLRRQEARDPAVRLTFANDPGAHLEVTRLLSELGLPVPRILEVDGGAGLMLTEDVGAIHLQDWISQAAPDAVIEKYDQALDFAVRIQELIESLPANSICRALSFDVPKLKWELDFFQEHYFNQYVSRQPGAEIVSGIQREILALCEELAALPRVLVHRDYHARNLMMKGDEMSIIDYQDARLGPETYDVVSLLCDPYAGLSGDMVWSMVDHFLGSKERSQRQLNDPKRFLRDFHLMTIQRMLKAVGTYSYQAVVRRNSLYIPYIQPALDWALSAMRILDEFPLLRNALEP